MTALSAVEELRILQLELDTAKRKLADTRRKLREAGRHSDRVGRAYTDALLLAGQHTAYLATTRRQAIELAAITQRRWEGAMALLKLARVHNGRRWQCHDLEAITRRLDTARQKALDFPPAYHARLCRHADQRKC